MEHGSTFSGKNEREKSGDSTMRTWVETGEGREEENVGRGSWVVNEACAKYEAPLLSARWTGAYGISNLAGRARA